MIEMPPVGSIWQWRNQMREVVQIDEVERRVGWRHPERCVVYWCFAHSWQKWAAAARRLT